MKKFITFCEKVRGAKALLLFVSLCLFFVLTLPSFSRAGSIERYKTNWAADLPVHGKITDKSTGAPLPGVSVMISGSTTGVVSGSDGEYSLEAPKNTFIRFSLVGYETHELKVTRQGEFNVELQQSQKALDEVVVIGYGTQSKADVTGSIATVNAKQIQDRPVLSFEEALAGQLAGVQVQQTSAAPGGGISLKIRGTGSITAGNTPLYVIDGVPLDNSVSDAGAQGVGIGDQSPVNPLSTINPADIQSIDVLKDASATAIYGSRGSNGVVIITTKMGVKGKPQFNFNAMTGYSEIEHKIAMMDKYQYAQLQIDIRNLNWGFAGGKDSDPNSARSSVAFKIPNEFKDPSSLPSNDWQDLIYRKAPFQNYTISGSGGTDAVRYYMSGNYVDQDGIVVNSGFKKYAFRANIDAKISDRISVGFRLAPSLTVNNIISSGGIAYQGGVVVSALSNAPLYKVYNDDGTYAQQFVLHFDDGTTQNYSYSNSVAFAEGPDQVFKQFSTVGSFFTTIDISKGLTFKTSINADVNHFNNDKFIPSFVSWNPSNGSSFASTNVAWINENTFTYKNTFASKHNLNVLAGVTEQKSTFSSTSVYANNFPNDLVHTVNAGVVNGGGSFGSQWSLVSLLSRVTYNFDQKYFLTATYRRDGSSRFGESNKWGDFPSASVGWRVSHEDFMKNSKSISDLKLRASYGLTGNNQIGDYASVGLISGNNYVLGAGSGSTANGLSQTTLSNPMLGWEKSKEFDLGLDLGLFDNRVYLVADYYNRLTSDLLLDVPLPLSTGFSTALRNLGKVRNKGFEFSVESKNVQTNSFTWSTNLNISMNRNNVEALGPSGSPIIVANRAQENSLTHVTKIGAPLGSFYGYVFDGVFMNQAELDKYPSLPGARPGDSRLIDVNGDNKINSDDMTVIGDNYPDAVYGFINNFTYKNFDLNISLQAIAGLQVINLLKRSNYRNIGADFLNYWRSESQPGDGKTFQPGTSTVNRNISSWLVEDASFIRIKNVTFGYRFGNLFRGNVLKNARIYVNVQNLFTFTKYKGYNPEVNTTQGDPYISSSLTPGIDYGTYPLARTYSLGLNLGF